jgi:ribose transport system substrate-binding protein
MKKLCKVMTVVMVITCLFLTPAFAGGEEEAAAAAEVEGAAPAVEVSMDKPGEGLLLGLSVIGTEHNWDINAYNGFLDRAEELGAEVLAFDGERRNEKQLSDVNTLISRKTDVIAVILGVKDSLVPALEEARSQGIPVVTADFAVAPSLCNVASNNFTAMAELALKMVSDMNGSGEIGIFFRPGSPIAELRKKVLDLVLSEYTDIKIVAQEAYILPGTVPDAYNKTQDMLRANPNIKAFWSVFDMPMIGAAQAIADMGLAGKVGTYGFDGDPTAMQIIMDPDGAFAATVAQQPYAIGERLAEQAIRAALGVAVPVMDFVPHVLVTRDNVQEVFDTLPQYK